MGGQERTSFSYSNIYYLKLGRSGSSSDNYIIDPDGKGGVAPFSVYCDMSDKGGVGVTVISHDSESRTHVIASVLDVEVQVVTGKM